MAILKVLPKGEIKVPDYAALPRTRRFHGWTVSSVAGEAVTDSIVGIANQHQEYIKGDEVIALPASVEYVRDLKAGLFWAADQATAQLAGIAFDGAFGGEFPKLATKPAPVTGSSTVVASPSPTAKSGS